MATAANLNAMTVLATTLISRSYSPMVTCKFNSFTCRYLTNLKENITDAAGSSVERWLCRLKRLHGSTDIILLVDATDASHWCFVKAAQELEAA